MKGPSSGKKELKILSLPQAQEKFRPAVDLQWKTLKTIRQEMDESESSNTELVALPIFLWKNEA